MEYYSHENGFLEELISLKSHDPFEAIMLQNGWSFDDGFSENNTNTSNDILPNTTAFQDYYSFPNDYHHQSINSSSLIGEIYNSHLEFTDSSNTKLDETPPFIQSQEDYSFPVFDDEVPNGIENMEIHQQPSSCKMEKFPQSENMQSFNMGIFTSPEKRNKLVKKVNGQPSKNLMAERRRRKRLNDRLSMLRSIVPKISKMDRTAILSDTIDYMKELLEKINNLQEGTDQEGLNQLSIFKDVKPNEVLVKTSPKFDVERRNMDTRLEICCAGKPGLLLSTMTAIEALGLEIQQCVISCFNEFAMQASCSEDLEQREVLNSEDIKQTLFRNAGYGGRCL